MATPPNKGPGPQKTAGVTSRARNRPLVEVPVVISDGSCSDDAATPRPTQGVLGVNTTPGPISQGPPPKVDEAGPTHDSEKEDVEPSVGLPPRSAPSAEDAVSAWAEFVAEGIKSMEEAGRAIPSAQMPDVPKTKEYTDPEGAVGAPDSRRAPMVGPLSLDWPAFPRSTGSFSFSDMAALGRRDAVLVKEYTETDATWGESVRSRFLQNHWIAYQVPSALPCDRTMVFDALDGLYLEGMLQFLTGERSLPMSVDSRFWAFDLPVPSQAGERTEYDYLRTQWSVSYGFGRVISFADHDSLRVDESPQARYDVITAANARQTRYRVPLSRFPVLPKWIRELGLPGGLCVKLPRILLYHGSEVEAPDRFRAHTSRLQYAVRLEVARAVANALDLDFRWSQIVWIVSDNVLTLLREFAKTPKVTVPSHGNHASCLRGIDDVESACRSARALGNEYLFERVHVPSGTWSRWAFLSESGFVKAHRFAGPTRGGRAVLRAPAAGSSRGRMPGRPSDPGTKYSGGFGSVRRRVSPEPHKQTLSGPTQGVTRYAALSSVISDSEIRQAVGLRGLLQGHTVRDGGWSVRELLSIALGRADAADRAVRETESRLRNAEDRLAASERNVVAWREHSERGGRGYSTAEGSRRHSTGQEARYTDPYAQPEPKRTRYSHGEREPEYDPYAQRQRELDLQAASVPLPYDSYDQAPYRGPRSPSDRRHR